MARVQQGYRCSACGAESAAYAGRCPRCQAWNTLEASRSPRAGTAGRVRRGVAAGRTIGLAAVGDDPGDRLVTDIPEFDRVLGGGIVPGSLVLVGGEPGIGKSTLMLQAASRLAARGVGVAYVCGEESPRQLRMRATRLGVSGEGITLIAETGLEAALGAAEAVGTPVLIIDSIQSIHVEGLESRSGGPGQLTEAGARLVEWAKGNAIATIVTGHVTKGGDIAGPRLLEHLVDAVLYFESAESGLLRILRAVKNRFGATDEVGVFEMTGEGLRSVDSASSAFLGARDRSASGCAVTAVIEGSRPLVVEVQALAVPSQLAAPRRIASGLETTRLHLLLAVLARRGGLSAANMDVVATVSGGLKLRDPGGDLAVVAALASAIHDRELDPATALLGEVALSGTVRPVQQAQRRLSELARLGFTRCVVPAGTPACEGVELVQAGTVRAALRAVLPPRSGPVTDEA